MYEICMHVKMKLKGCIFVALQMNAPMVQIDGHENVPQNDEHALMKSVAKQPVSVAIDAGSKDFQFYSEASSQPS